MAAGMRETRPRAGDRGDVGGGCGSRSAGPQAVRGVNGAG